MHIRCNPYLPQLTLPYKSLGKCSIFKVVAKEATSVELSNRKKKSITLHNFFFMHTVDFANSQRGNVCFFLCLLYLFFSFLWSSYVLFFRYFILLYLFSSLLTNIFSFCILICSFYYLLFSDLFCQLYFFYILFYLTLYISLIFCTLSVFSSVQSISGFCSNSISLLSFVLYLYFLLDYRFLLVIGPIYSIFLTSYLPFYLYHLYSVTRCGEISPLWQQLTRLWLLFEDLFCNG